MRRLIAWACLLASVLAASPSDGLLLRGSGVGVNPATGAIVGFNTAMFPFVNLMKMANFAQPATTTFIYPNYLQNLTQLPTGTIPSNLGFTVQIPSNYFGKYVIALTGTLSGGAVIQIGNSGAFGQIYAKGASTTLTGCSNGDVPPCAFGNTATFTGTNPTVTVDLSVAVTGVANNGSGLVRATLAVSGLGLNNGQQITTTGVVGSDGNGCGANGSFTLSNVASTTVDLVGSTFDPGCTYSSGGQLFPWQVGGATPQFVLSYNAGTYSLSGVIMCELADYNADNTCNTKAGKTAWPKGFNDDFISSVAAIRPPYIRMLDVNNIVYRIPPDWNGYPSESAWTYNAAQSYFAMTNWFGTASGTNSYSASCVSPCTYTLTSGAPKDGDFFHFYLSNANTTANATLAVTDASSVTSSAIPLLLEGLRESITMGGSRTPGDTIALQFSSTCLSGGTHTTSAYSVKNTDTLALLAGQLGNLIVADATLTAQPVAMVASWPSAPTLFFAWATNACTMTAINLVVTGAGTETALIGTMPPTGSGFGLTADTLYTGVYKSLHGAIIVNIEDPGGTSSAWPWSVQVALASAVSTKLGLPVGCWLQPNLLWSDASFTSLATYLNSNRCPGGTILEDGNEDWNPGNSITAESTGLAASIGLGSDFVAYYELRQRQLWGIASSVFGGLAGNLYTAGMYQLGLINASELEGATLCGTSCGNTAYQNAIGVDYNAAPNRPVDYTRVVGQAPYYQGSILNGNYQSAASYGSWSAASSSVAGNILTVNGTVTGTIWWNQGISSCDGAYIAAPNPSNPTSAQLSGTVTKTATASWNDNAGTFSLNNTSSLQAGMWIYDQNTGTVNGRIGSINSGANTITVASGTFNTYRSASSSDTLIFGGLAGTYQLNSTSCAASSSTITGGDILGLQYAADNYNHLNSALGSQQDAYNWLYQDTYLAANNNYSPSGNSIASMSSAFNTISGVASNFSVPVWDYEGGNQIDQVTAGAATSMGLPSSAYGYTNGDVFDGYIANMLLGWRNSATYKTLETKRHSFELALLPANSKIMWFNFEGSPPGTTAGPWQLYGGDLYAPPAFQSYNAICDYNGGSC